ncbi:MAG: pyridoxal phosphate-dependent aminotransferase family protein [Nanoarchaeota archaeon]|nr:pyridoxal phosphate-dependent aminotransferase family protein [Nanoarchaeota archaeon]
MEFIESLYVDKTILKKAKFNPYYKQVETGLGKKVIVGGKPLISLGSNDYLAIANSDELKNAAREALEKYGVSMCGTPIVVGYTKINKDLESKIASFLQQDEALVFPSGYQASLGAFHLANRKDVIIADRYAHSCLIQGAQSSKAKLLRFFHNDMERLETFLKNSQNSRMRFIVVDGLYSIEGDIAPLDKIVELAKEYKAFTIVDDAHGLGILGKKGKGSLEVFNVLDKIDLVTGSLGKALGSAGGFIATNKSVANFLRYMCAPFIYSTALPPVLAAPAIVAIDLVEKSEDRRQKLFRNKEKLYNSVKELGYNLTNSTTPLFSIISREAEQTIQLAKDLYENGVYATPFVPPSVPKGRSCLRFIPHAGLEEDDINQIIDIFKNLGGKYV